jgi:hypothetical protein
MKLSGKLYPIALGAGIALGTLTAAAAQVKTETQFAVGRNFQMPAGDFAAPRGAPIRETSRGRPDEAGLLKELKQHSGRPAELGIVATTQRSTSSSSVVTGANGGCNTNNSTDYTPSDIHGAVGLTNLVTTTNVDIGVYSKMSNCPLISRVPLTTFFGAFNIPASQTLFDARVLYDPSVDRFLVTADSADDYTYDQTQYYAVSQDGSGTSWWTYAVALIHGTYTFCVNSDTDFWDYPSAGSSSTRWYITANDSFGTSNTVAGAILSIDKMASLNLNNNPDNVVAVYCFKGLQSNVAPPIITDSSRTAYFLSPGGSGFGNSIRGYALTPSAQGPFNDQLTGPVSISIPRWTAAPQAAQPNGQRLDTLDGRFQSANIQTGTSLWNVHTINVGNFARWRLYKFSIATHTATVLATPTTSTCSNCDHLFNPSVAVNNLGKAFVTATRTIPSKSGTGNAAMLIFSGPNSSAWTSTNSGFNLVTTSATQFVYAINGAGTNYVRCNRTDIQACRWGDYSATQIDPSNTATAWGFNQLITGATAGEPGVTEFDWSTNAAQVQ